MKNVPMKERGFGSLAWNKGKTKVDQSECKDGEKRCSTCLEIQRITDYHRNHKTVDGRTARCKACDKKLRKPPDREQVALNRQKRNNYKSMILREYELMLEIEERRSQPARIQIEGIT